MSDPTPAPLTDEQIERYAGIYRQIAVDAVGFPKVDADVRETFDRWLAAVIARAKREERERIATAVRVTHYQTHGPHVRIEECKRPSCAVARLFIDVVEATDDETR